MTFAVSRHWPVVLIDTFVKDGRTLLDWVGMEDVSRRLLPPLPPPSGVRVALLAGSLRLEQIEGLCRFEPDWLAVRSAACTWGAGRDQAVCAERVHALVARSFVHHSLLPSKTC